MVGVDAEGEAVVEGTEVDTGVDLCGGLPLQVGVGDLAGLQTDDVLT